MDTFDPATVQAGPSQDPPPRTRHRVRNSLIAAGTLVAGVTVAGVVAAAGGGSAARPAPAVTVTRAVPGVPGVTPARSVATATRTAVVHVTQTAVVPPAPLTVARYAGTGMWNSPQFSVNGNPLTVKFSYWDNTSGYGGDNFIADVTSTDMGDDLPIANEIAASGGKTTTLYPSGSGLYHLEVQATGPWSVTISQAAG